MRKPRLILHIGSHKTGTTGIQRFCDENREILLQQGIFYPSYALIGEKEHYAHHSLASGLAGQDGDWTASKVCRFLKVVAERCPEGAQVMLSSEVFYRQLVCGGQRKSAFLTDHKYWQARRRYIEVVAHALDDFDVEIAAVFRKQPDFLNSLYQEVIKVTRFSGTAFELYLRKRHDFNYYAQIKTWADSFPRIRVLVFEDLLKGGNLIHEFLNTISTRTLSLPDDFSLKNPSLHPLVIEAKRQLNSRQFPSVQNAQGHVSSKNLRKLQDYALTRKIIAGTPKHSYLTPSEGCLLSLSCRTANAMLRNEYFPEGTHELEQYIPSENLVDFRDVRAVKTIKRLLAKIDRSWIHQFVRSHLLRLRILLRPHASHPPR